MILTESQKTALAKLKFRDPKRYQEKMDAIGAREEDILRYIDKELERRGTVSRIKKPVFSCNKNHYGITVDDVKKDLQALIDCRYVYSCRVTGSTGFQSDTSSNTVGVPRYNCGVSYGIGGLTPLRGDE